MSEEPKVTLAAPKITSVEPKDLKITSVKPKDPKRVAAGKKLAQISKEAKERKLRSKIQSEEEYNYFSIVAVIGGLVFAGASLYYTYESYTNAVKPKPRPEPRRVTNTLDSLD